MLTIGYKGKAKYAVKCRMNAYTFFPMLKSVREIPHIYPLSLSKFKCPRILSAC